MKFPTPCGPVLTDILNFWQIPTKIIAYSVFHHDQHTYSKVWLKSNENWEKREEF